MTIGYNVPRESDLQPIIWSELPQNMIELVLCKLPFANIVRLRLVCKAWDRIILSMCSAPGNPSPKQLLVCSPMGGGLDLVCCSLKDNNLEDWYPSFLCPLLQPTGGLCLVAAGIGLLCFSTKNSGRLLIWNPISKMSRQLPPAHVSSRVNPQDLFRNCHHAPSPTTALAVTIPPASTALGSVMVTLLTYRHARRFKVFVAGSFENNQTLQLFDSMTSSWKMIGPLRDGRKLRFESDMVVCNNCMYAIMDGLSLSQDLGLDINDESSSNLWSIVKYDMEDEAWSDHIPPPLLVMREQQLQQFHTTQRPQLVVVHEDNMWLIVEGLLNCSVCFYELEFQGLRIGSGMIPPWRLVKEISRDLFWGTMVVLHKCIAVEELIYFRLFDILSDGSAQLVMLVHNIFADSWSFLNDPDGLDGRYFLYHTFVYEPSLNAMI